ncbi:type II secretion system protein [Victivallis sp. Marseille-Q1083]|uniref:type II secretion system protein n=1 Tax=Victivallis sp. Marseille-Q1083 TaxID=2717288 RepID=UPI0015898F48|nr:hypothetical protein [Victivallis sp. Marseille-Q1083]
MRCCRKRNNFTLLEVLIAVAILGMTIMAIIAMVGTAKIRSLTAARDLRENHMLVQAVEYWLLDVESKELPPEFFPYPEYTAERILENVDDLPKGISASRGNWRLVKMTVNLLRNGEICQTISVERLARQLD